MPTRLHDDELPIDTAMVRRLVDSQFPRHAHLPLSPLSATGSSNALFRLGHDLLVRLPRQPGGGATVEKERRWSPEVASHLPVAVPEIIAIGDPGSDYDERWSIVRWLPGNLPRACELDAPADPARSELAVDLAKFILALRATPVPEAAVADPSLRSYRGRPLVEFDRTFRSNVSACRAIEGLHLDLDAALALWEKALESPGASGASNRTWYHSDLVAENLLLTHGRLCAVLDFGGLSIGDPAIDLHGGWELFDREALNVFRRTLNVSESEWLRGRAWALAIALGCFSYYWGKMPERCRDRLIMARSVLMDANNS